MQIRRAAKHFRAYDKYAWDAENRLIGVEPGGTPGEGDEKVEFAYDYLGRRIEKKVSTWNVNLNPPDWEVTLKRRFVWAGGGTGGWLMLMELDGLNSNAVVRQYTWGLDLAGQAGSLKSLESAGGIGGLLAVHDATVGETGADYVHTYDANGNVGQVIDLSAASASASMVAKYEYDPYGNVTAQSGDYAETNPFRFSTKYWDDETGLGYWGYRYYNPKLGRWISRNPIEEPGFANLYAYGTNASLNGYDPDGRLWTWACCTLCLGSIGADIGGGAIGCLTGCLQYAGGGYSVSQCFKDCIISYLADRMDHTQAYNIYKSVVEAASCVCCGIRLITDPEPPPPPPEPRRPAKPQPGCMPCVPPVGTTGYRGPDSGSHGGITGSHIHYYVMSQSPPTAGCQCFWLPIGTVPGAIPAPGAVPIGPAGGGGIAPAVAPDGDGAACPSGIGEGVMS